MAKAIPEGLHSVTPSLTVEGCGDAIEFWKRAFGAQEVARAVDPSGKRVWHAQVRIGDSAIFANDAMPEMGSRAQPSRLWIYIDGVDQAWKRAVDAGCQVKMPISDMFWGDRCGTVVDKWGNEWTLAQRIKDLTPDQMKQAQDEFVKKMQQQKR
jgi:PhnB protein